MHRILLPMVQSTNAPALVLIMTKQRPDNKPLAEKMMVSLSQSQNISISADTSYMHTILNTEGKTKSMHWYTTSVMMYIMLL